MSKTNYWQKFEETGIYHVYNRGIDGMTIFKREEQYNFFLKKWKDLIIPFFDIYAYCLLPNHFHFLVEVKTFNESIKSSVKKQGTSKSLKLLEEEIDYNVFLEDQFKRLFSSYALRFNTQENRTGSLFQKRFKRVLVKDAFRVVHLIAYIHHNPIHHRLANDFQAWKFSSYRAFLNPEKYTLLSREKVWSYFDEGATEKEEAFMDHHTAFRMEKKTALLYLE